MTDVRLLNISTKDYYKFDKVDKKFDLISRDKNTVLQLYDLLSGRWKRNRLAFVSGKYSSSFESLMEEFKYYDDDDDDDDGRGFAFFRECGPSCRCSRDCPNRASTRGVSVRLSIRPTSCGLGVFAEEPIVAGRRVCGYFGEVVSAEEAASRVAASDARPGASHYVLAVRRARADDAEDRGDVSWIDPATRGNVGRWLNHSCDGGNLTTVLTRSAGESASRVVFHARRDIASGTELRWRYGKPRGEGEGGEGGRRCACGTSACRGWMPFDDHGER